MNIKRTTNSQLSTTESKTQTKQIRTKQNHRYGDHLEGYQLGEGRGRMEEKIQRLRSTIGWYRIDRGMLSTV